MDLLYVLGTGSLWNNNEIRYSIRSALQYTDVEKIYLVGEKPDWLKPDYYLNVKDPFKYNKPGNIFYKLYKACKELPLQEDFVFMADDYIFNKPQKLSEMPYYCRKQMQLWNYSSPPPSREYDRTLYNNSQYLRSKDLPTINYDMHCPMRVDKFTFLKMAEEFSFPSKGVAGWNVNRRSISWRSCYGNYAKLSPVIPKKDFKVFGFEEQSFLDHLVKVGKITKEQAGQSVEEQAKGMPFFSVGIPIGVNGGWFRDRFPEPSKYEINK